MRTRLARRIHDANPGLNARSSVTRTRPSASTRPFATTLAENDPNLLDFGPRFWTTRAGFFDSFCLGPTRRQHGRVPETDSCEKAFVTSNNVTVALSTLVLGGVACLVGCSLGVSGDPSLTTPSAGGTGGTGSGGTAGTSPSVERFPGDPNPLVSRQAHWGVSMQGDPEVLYELPAERAMSIRRTYWDWESHDTPPLDSLYNHVRLELAAGRLPLLTLTLPPWEEVSAGLHRERIQQLLTELDSLGKPIWIAADELPEYGDKENKGDDADGVADAPNWRGAQRHVRDQMLALETKNIAFMPIFSSWTFDRDSGLNPEDWWEEGVWDAVLVTHLNSAEESGLLNGSHLAFIQWANLKKLPHGFVSIRNAGNDAASAAEMDKFWEWGFVQPTDTIANIWSDSSLADEERGKFIEILKTDERVVGN